MVYKKHGYHTRRKVTRGSHIYKKQLYMIRLSTYSLHSAVFYAYRLDKLNVPFSINKNGLWLVSELLKLDFFNIDDGFQVEFIECHKLKRKVQHTDFHSYDGFPRKVLSKKTYFDLDVLKCKSSVPTKTIVCSCPTSSFFAGIPKNAVCSPTLQSNNATMKSANKVTNPQKIVRRTQRTKMFMENVMDEWQAESDYFENEDDDINPEEEAYKPHSASLCFGDILSHSSDMQKIHLKEMNSFQNKDAVKKPYNQHPLTEQGVENGATENPSTTRPSVTNSMAKHVTVFIPNTEVLMGHLQEMFGEEYVECRCFPRKFIIDITEKVTSTILKSKAFQNRDMNRVDLSAILVFTYDMFGSLDCTDMDAFKVSINMKTRQSCLTLDTLPDNSVLGIEEIVQGAISYITSISCDNFVSKDIPSHITKSARTNHNILKLYNTEITFVSPENITVRDILKENKNKHYTMTGQLDIESLPPDFCSICFESILDSPATALQTCGHWFCDRCWNDHVISTASCSTGRVTCPEYKCGSTVDNDILLTTTNLQTVEKMFKRQIDKEANSKWCPNKKCGRVARYENKEIGKIMNVTCECGTTFCFDCLQPVHWPLSCRDHDRYLEKLKEQNHIGKDTKTEVVFTITVRGKHCPVCNAFIEKDGGCFDMKCVCGNRFCWGCLRIKGEYHRTPCFGGNMYDKPANIFKLITKKIVQHIYVDLPNDQLDWYKRMYNRAVRIRFGPNPSKVKIMMGAVRAMCRTLTSYKRRQDTGIGAELENVELPDSHQCTCVMDKIHPFLISMIDVYQEASLICKYTTVFLENCQSRNIIQIRDNLQRITKDIYKNFRDSNNVDLKSSITRLFHLRIECEKAINELVDTMV